MGEMNESWTNVTLVLYYRDSFSKAVVKNVLVVVFCFAINYINIGLIWTFGKHQIFYTNPRYILFVHLVVNDMLQVTLTVVMFVLSYVLFQIRASICCVLLLVALFATENTPLNLACMAVECYIAVCIPLRHVQICTVRRTLTLIGLIWTITLLSLLPDLFITLATQPLDLFHSNIFCLRKNVFPGVLLLKKREITYIIYLVLVWLIIFFTYFKILFTAKAANKDAKKARNTVVLHGFQLVLCMAGYAEPLLRNLLFQLFPKNITDMRFVIYIFIYILPRSISPIIYGVRDKTFRTYLKRHLMCNANSC